MDDATDTADVVSDSLPGSEEGELDIDLDIDGRLGDSIKKEQLHEKEESESPEANQTSQVGNGDSATSPHKILTGYQCKLCTVLLSSQSALDEHMNIHSGSRPYKCRECNFSCSLHNTLIQHLAVHSHQRADMNSQSWAEQHSLYNNHTDRHSEHAPLPPRMPLPENHTPSLPFSAAVEQALMPSGLPSFPDQSKVFQCKLCTHISPTKTHLNEHMNVHTGKKPYKCLVCGFSSAFRSSLMRHLIVHTGTSKQFKCDSCHYQTPYKCNLQAHRRKRHNSNSNIDSIDMNYPPISSSNQPPLEDSPPLQSHSKLYPSEEQQARYLMQSELTNSTHSTHPSHENSGNRRHSLSPDDHDSSASNDTHDSARINNSQVSLSKVSDFNRYNSEGSVVPQSPEPPVLEKNTLVGEAENNERPKSGEGLDYSSPTMTNNIQDMMANTSQSAISILSNSVSSASSALGLPSVGNFVSSMSTSMVTSIPSTSPQHPLSEISVITPLQWAGAGFPIYRRKKEGGARKRKRTPIPKRNYLISPNGEDVNNSWADMRPEIAEYVRSGGESQARQYCQVTQAYSLKTEDTLPYAMKPNSVNGVDLSVGSRDVIYPDMEPISNSSVSPLSQNADEPSEERNHVPQHLPVMVEPPSQVSLSFNQASQATQTDLQSFAGNSSGKLDGQSQTDQAALDPSSVPSNLLKCPHCETYFADHVIFTLHMSCHGSRHPFQCSICGYVCRDKIEFTCHITRSQHMR